MAGFEDFINLFAPPGVVEAQRDREAQQATAQSLRDLIVGNQQPFEADLFPGEQQIPGLSTGQPGALPESSQRDFIAQLLQSESPGFAQQGIGLANQSLSGLAQRDLAANARKSLQESRQSAVGRLNQGSELSPQNQFLAEIFSGGGPSSQDAFKSLGKQFDPFTLSTGQTRFGGLGNQIATAGVDPTKRRAAETGLRKEFTGKTERFAVSDEAMSRIKALGTTANPTAATDNALLFQYARLLSPGIVTQDDFENAMRAGGEGLPSEVRQFFSKMVDGKLLEDARRNLVNAAAVQFSGEADLFRLRKQDYVSLAERNELNVESVTGTRRVRTDVSDLIGSPGKSQQIGRFKVKVK